MTPNEDTATTTHALRARIGAMVTGTATGSVDERAVPGHAEVSCAGGRGTPDALHERDRSAYHLQGVQIEWDRKNCIARGVDQVPRRQVARIVRALD